MPLRRDPNYPSAVKHLFLHSHGPAARLRPGKPLGMSLVTLSCHRYTDHPSLPFVNKAHLSMVPVWENLFSLFCDKCEGHYLCHGQRYWILLMWNQLDVGIQKVEINWFALGQRMLFRNKNVVESSEAHRRIWCPVGNKLFCQLAMCLNNRLSLAGYIRQPWQALHSIRLHHAGGRHLKKMRGLFSSKWVSFLWYPRD